VSEQDVNLPSAIKLFELIITLTPTQLAG